jgi:L-alanine-DL-glutamate epimerase-like enolase superfamily enzyme
LASAFADTDLVEYKTGSAYIDEIALKEWELDDDGMLTIPHKPGLGLELNFDAVAKYAGGKRLLGV